MKKENKSKNVNCELSESELNNVSGGGSCNQDNSAQFEKREFFDNQDDKNFLYQIGEEVRFSKHPNARGSSGTIYTCKIHSRCWLTSIDSGKKSYLDYYSVEGEGLYSGVTYNRTHFVKK